MRLEIENFWIESLKIADSNGLEGRTLILDIRELEKYILEDESHILRPTIGLTLENTNNRYRSKSWQRGARNSSECHSCQKAWRHSLSGQADDSIL